MMKRALLPLLPLILTGCIVIRLSTNKPEGNVADPATVDSLLGLSQAEVIQRMGSPHYRFTLEKKIFFLYESTGESTWMRLAHPVVIAGGVPPVLVQTDLEAYCALLEFGPDDTVQRTVTRSDVVQRDVKKSAPSQPSLRLPCISVLASDTAIKGHKADLHAQAKAGGMEAANQLGNIFDDPRPLEILLEREEIRKAQEGDPEAQLRAYWNKIGSTPVIWLCRAADLGHPDACNRLASLYEFGHEGLPRDSVRAHLWFTLASEHGHGGAKDEAARLASTVLSVDQLEQAKLLRAHWLPGQCEADLNGASEPR